MPLRDFQDINEANLIANNHDPGYEWMEDRFGPPPGIPRREKERLDRLADQEYIKAYLAKPVDEVESLMCSEVERRRSFRSTWQYEDKVAGAELAKAGFYFLNAGDRVKCAFCTGVIRMWNHGDRPMERHNKYFGFCKFAQGREPNNIPFDEVGLGLQDSVDTSMPSCSPEYRTHNRRAQTFGAAWPAELRGMVPKICDAGLYHIGPGDRVACFHCGGTLEEWKTDDDPWKEHAKWYYQCSYVIVSKGGDYIRNVRSQMTTEEISESEQHVYKKSTDEDTGDVDVAMQALVRNYSSYQFLHQEMEYSHDLIMQAYQLNQYKEYKSPSELLTVIYSLQDGEISPGDKLNFLPESDDLESLKAAEEGVKEAVENGDPLSDTQSQLLLQMMTCQICLNELSSTVLLPCGCLQICKKCKAENLPTICPRCEKIVHGAVTPYLS